jgi:hypothetical protein
MTDHPIPPDDAFYLQYGKALAEWANLELVLSYWFTHLSGMGTAMASAVFYSVNSFDAKNVMLLAALREAKRMRVPGVSQAFFARRNRGEKLAKKPLESQLAKFLTKAFSKAAQYSEARNKIAHQLSMTNQDTLEVQLVERGRWWERDGLKINHLHEIETNFKSLKTILRDVWVYVCVPEKTLPRATPEEGLQQLCALPKQAHPPLPSQNPGGQQGQPPPSSKKPREPKLSSAERRERALQPKGEQPS